MKKNKDKLGTLVMILFVVSLLLSLIRVFMDFRSGVAHTDSLLFALDILTAIVWALCLILELVCHYMKKNRKG